MKGSDNRSSEERWNKVYDDLGRDYQLYLYQHQLLDVIRSCFDSLKNKTILEIGCGKGNELIQLAREGATCSGLDFSESAIQFLSSRLRIDRIDSAIIRGDARSIPLRPGEFDLVFSQGVLEHFHDPNEIVKEQRRVLKQGGYIVIEVPNKWTLYTVYKKTLMWLDRWPPGWETEYSPKELSDLIVNAGFEIVDCVGWDFFFLKVVRTLKRKMGLRQRPENRLTRIIRNTVQRNALLLYLFSSIIIVGRKR